MKTKVTLSLDEDFVKKAKLYAKAQKKSLSQAITESLKDKMRKEERIAEKLKIHKRLAGSIKLMQEDVNKSVDELRYEALKKKYDLP